MAVKYVNSGAGGSNDGSDWTNAWTSLASATGVNAGDEIYVHDAHSEDPGAAVTYNFSNGTAANPVRVYCVDKDASDALSTGAAITQGTTGRGITIASNVVMDGMSFTATDDLNLCNSSAVQKFFNCAFASITQTTSNNTSLNASGGHAEYINCTFTHIASTSQFLMTSSNVNGLSLLRNCTITLPTGTAEYAYQNGPRQRAVFIGCKFSGTCTTLVNLAESSGSYNGFVQMIGCELPTYTNLISESPLTPHSQCSFEQCETGTVTVMPQTLTAFYSYWGTCTSTTAIYRTGGADDGEQANAYSWKLVSTANCVDRFTWFSTPNLTRLVEGGTEKTFTVYVAGDATLQNDELWIELDGPDSAATAKAQFDYLTTRVATRGTAANLTTDGDSTWNGTGVGTKQKMSITYTPTLTGIVRVRVCLAKASTTVYVDPQIVVS